MPPRRPFRNDLQCYGFLHDPAGRARRGRRIVALLRRFHREDLSTLRVLDVGCSAGLMTQEISRYVAFSTGIDPDPLAMRHAQSQLAEPGKLAFACCAGEALPFADETFDVVLCNHVYEHAADPSAMLREIARVLRRDGVCYFAGGHTWQLIEPHYGLPLLSLLPRAIASWMLRASGRGDRYEIRFLPPWRLPTLFAPFTRATSVTAAVLRESERFELIEGPMRLKVVRTIVRHCAPLAALLAPTQLWLLRRS